jgi:hypothetical protein
LQIQEDKNDTTRLLDEGTVISKEEDIRVVRNKKARDNFEAQSLEILTDR